MTTFHSFNSARKPGIDLLQKLKWQKLIHLKPFKKFDFYKAKLWKLNANLQNKKK